MMETEKKFYQGNEKEISKKSGGFPSLLLFILLGLVVGIGIKLFCFDILKVSGSSMNPAITSGSHILINKLAFGLVKPFGDELVIQWKEPRRGDVVLYFYHNKAVIKRCVAVAGDRLEFSHDFGYSLAVNEKNIPLQEAQYQKLKHNQQVPPGMILAVGDNYDESVDSRDYGFVSVKNVLGRIIGK